MKEKDCILVVDDDEGTRKSLTLLLKRKGFETERAETGKEALAIAQGRPIDLTLLDIKLPDIEGVELLAPLKKTNPDMSIIMITGFASVESAVQSLTAGASGYITKPIDLDEMLARIKNALDHQHLVSEVRWAEEKIESLAKFPEENPNPVLRVANDGVLIYANKSAEFILNQLKLSVCTKVPEFLEKILKEAIESGSRLELEKIVNGKTYLFTIAPIIGQNYVNLYGLDITKRKKAEEALKISLAKYKVFFEAFPLAITVSDKMGKIIESNVRAEEILGLSAEEQSKRKIDGTEWQLIRPDGTPMPADEYASVRALKENCLVHNVEMGIVRGNSAVTWISVTAAPIPLKDYGVAIAYSDITERKNAENALKESEAILKRTGEIARIGGWELDTETLAVRWTEETYHIHEVPVDQMPPPLEDAINFFHPDERHKLSDAIKLALTTGAGYDMELRFITATGKHRWTRTVCQPEVIDGKIIRLIGTFQDITERKKAEEEIKESFERFKMVMDGLDALVYVVDMETYNLLFVNKYGIDVWGDIEGKVCWQTIQNDQSGPCPFCTNDRLVDSKGNPTGVYNWEFRNTVTNRWYDCRDSAIRWLDGRLVRLEIATDITGHKQIEEQLKHFNEELELAVKERTDKLDKSLHEKEILLKEIHHRVKNNLQIVISLLNLQSRYIKDETILNAIKESQNRIRAMALVHEKLYKSEDISHIDLSDYIRFLATSLFSFHNISPQKIRLTIDMKEVRIDINSAIPIGLIINELVSNSLKYAFPQGTKGEIVITGRKDADTIIIQIKDTGIGMPEGLDWKNAESLGLRLVISLVEQLQGTIELEKGPGTLFRLTLHEKT